MKVGAPIAFCGLFPQEPEGIAFTTTDQPLEKPGGPKKRRNRGSRCQPLFVLLQTRNSRKQSELPMISVRRFSGQRTSPVVFTPAPFCAGPKNHQLPRFLCHCSSSLLVGEGFLPFHTYQA